MRREREVYKIRLAELAELTTEEIGQMVRDGDIELMVLRSDLEDGAAGGWSKRVAKLFEDIAASVDLAPDHENRTIFVNIVADRGER